MEESIVYDKNLRFTVISYAAIFVIFANLTTVHLPLIGTIASITFFLINGIFLGHGFFTKNPFLLRFMLGNLLLLVLLGLVGWAVMIGYNLDVIRVAIVLITVATLCSLVNRLGKKNSQQGYKLHAKARVTFPRRLHCLRFSYLFMVVVSFYFLFISRSGEVHTVWEVIHPLFIPTFFITSLLLVGVIISPDKVNYKLFFIILHSILSHIFIVVIFPAGNVGVQQEVLGKTRLVFDNVIFHGFGWSVENIPRRIYTLCRGDNLQTAYSVVIARMFGVDVYWSHLLLIPILWGVFLPIIAFIISKVLSKRDKVSFLASLLISSFPASIIWGAASVPYALSSIFFLFSVYFSLKYVESNRMKTSFLAVTVCIIDFLAHFLAGMLSFSLLLLAMAVRKYENEKAISPRKTKIWLLISFAFCTSIVPFALVYRTFFHPEYTYFSLENLGGLPTTELAWLLIFGIESTARSIILLFRGIIPLVGLITMIYLLRVGVKKTSSRSFQTRSLFLITAFLMLLVDYRILKFLMVGVPFEAERLWLLQNMIAVPFVAIITESAISFLGKTAANVMNKIRYPFLEACLKHMNPKFVARYLMFGVLIVTYILIPVALSGLVTASVWYGYPHYGPLQTTPYELEGVKYIEKTAQTNNQPYIVICDQWITFAGQMFVGVANPRAFYFSSRSPQGTALFIEMKRNPSPDVMLEAMEINNATVAYFIIEEPRLGTEKYNEIIQQAQQNGVQTYKIFYHQGEEKLRIFYHNKTS